MTDEELAKAATEEGSKVVAACIQKPGALTGILANENALMVFALMMQQPMYLAARAKLLSRGHTEDDFALVEQMARGIWEAAK